MNKLGIEAWMHEIELKKNLRWERGGGNGKRITEEDVCIFA